MTSEPQLQDVSEENNRPATKGDVESLAAMTARGFSAIDERFEAVDNRLHSVGDRLDHIEETTATKKDLGRLEQGQQAMLVVLEENNQLLTEIRRLPERVERLERSVFRR